MNYGNQGNTPGYSRPGMAPPGYNQQQGDPRNSNYSSMLTELGNRPGMIQQNVPQYTREVNTLTNTMEQMNISGNNIFDTPISIHVPMPMFQQVQHQVTLPAGTDKKNLPVETNKFYGNMLLGEQQCPAWTHPYSLWWSKDPNFYGMAIAYIQENQRVYGPGAPPQYYFNPTGIKSFVFGATEFDSCNLVLSDMKHMSARALLKKSETQYIDFPLVQGMGFISAIYKSTTPKITSAVAVRTFNQATAPSSDLKKYEVVLENGVTWWIFLSKNISIDLRLDNPTTIISSAVTSETVIQLCVATSSEVDNAAGCYPIGCNLNGSVTGNEGNYSFNYSLEGSSKSNATLLYALPHHVETFTQNTASKKINSVLDATVSGKMQGYITDTFDMKLEVPDKVQFDPFTTIQGKGTPRYSSNVLNAIRNAAQREVDGDVINESNIDSMYTAGKILAKYAWILYSCHYVLNDNDLVQRLLPRLKQAFNRFTQNQQLLPLQYDTTWGGLKSSGTPAQDFGNAYYNDHHFHYGYHVVAAAILAKIDNEVGDRTWLSQNQEWMESLIRDFANPSDKDPYFPVFRSFDWYNGHSWAKGLFESGDGKDQESSSEDMNASYGLKLWGLVTNNSNLRQVADLELGIMRLSMNRYCLYSNDNDTEPASFIPNKVAGILFENKIDHTTYFGNELQYIQMIHAIPIIPPSSFIRKPAFVKEEWDSKLAGIVNNVNDGWKGIIMLNLALYDPQASYDFFSSPNFTPAYLDNGQSLTWSLVYSGAFLQ